MFARVSLSIYCRVLTKTQIGRQSFSQTRSLHTSHRIKNINSRIRCLGPHASHSIVLNANLVRFASTISTTSTPNASAASTTSTPNASAASTTSTTEATKVSTEDALPQIPEPPSPLDTEIVETIGEATLESYGLGGYLPTGLMQHCLYWIHNTCGLPWWATIILVTATLKIMLFPHFLKMQRHQALTRVHAKDLNYFEKKKKEALAEGSKIKHDLYSLKQDQFYGSHNMMTSKKTLLHYGIQGSVFFLFFWSMNGMAGVPIDSMREGGLMWFSDLTVPDPYYVLPLISVTSTALYVHFCPPPTMGQKLEGIKRYYKFIVPIVMLPFMIFLKSAILLYIMTTTWLTFLSQALIRIPKVRAFCKIPIVKESESVNPLEVNKPFIQTIKEIWQDMKHSKATNNAYLLDQKRFEAAGRAALVKTYKYNPVKEYQRQQNK